MENKSDKDEALPNFTFCNKELPESLDPDEIFIKLADAFKNEPHLLKASADELKESFTRGLSMIVFDAGKPVAHTRLVPLTEENGQMWYELGSTWVDSIYRGHGLNHRMYKAFLPSHDDKNILATTTNERSLTVGKDLGFVLVPRKALPEAVW